MKKIKFIFAFFLILIVFSSCQSFANRKTLFASRDYDVVLQVMPIKVKGITSQTLIDAVEEGFTDAKTSGVVSFRIEKVLAGEFTQVQFGGPSKFDQMKEAAQDKDFMKLIKSDFTDPGELTNKDWVTVAVDSPLEAFGITSWSNPGDQRYKIYLKRVPKEPNSFIFLRAEQKP